jgi:hypothetical protein
MTVVPIIKLFARGGVFITVVPIIKLFAWGEGDSGGHVLCETTSRGLCGLVCPSRTGAREEPGTLTQDGALFPNHRGSGAHPGRGWFGVWHVCVFITVVPDDDRPFIVLTETKLIL